MIHEWTASYTKHPKAVRLVLTQMAFNQLMPDYVYMRQEIWHI